MHKRLFNIRESDNKIRRGNLVGCGNKRCNNKIRCGNNIRHGFLYLEAWSQKYEDMSILVGVVISVSV